MHPSVVLRPLSAVGGQQVVHRQLVEVFERHAALPRRVGVELVVGTGVGQQSGQSVLRRGAGQLVEAGRLERFPDLGVRSNAAARSRRIR